MIFGSGKSFLIVGEWRLLGFAGTGKLPGKKWFLGWENHFVKLESGGCWDLLGIFFAVSILLLARLPGKESGGCWDLLGFLLLRCLLLFGRVPGKKMIFGWGKWFFWTWRLAIAGICWDFSFFALSTATSTWQTARKKMIFGSGKSFFWNWRVAIAGICWDFFFYGVDCCLAGCPEKNDFWVGKIIFLKLETSGCWDLMGFLLLRCLLSKRLVVLAYIGGLSFFFLPYRFGGVGERGGMVLLHVNDPPFFTTPYMHNRTTYTSLEVL